MGVRRHRNEYRIVLPCPLRTHATLDLSRGHRKHLFDFLIMRDLV